MAKNTDQLARSFEAENTGGLLSGFLAEEDELDRNALWRLGSWGAASVGAVIVALLASQSSIGLRRGEVAAADLVRQSQQIQAVAKESQNETRRLAAAIDTLNSDRDRLYSRVTVLEQGLDSVTGTIARQNSAAASAQAAATSPTAETQPAQSPAAAPAASPVATTLAAMAEKQRPALPEQAPAPPSSAAKETSNAPAATPATPLMASKSIMAPPDSAAGKLIEPDPVTPPKPVVASAPSADIAEADASQAPVPPQAVQRTEFGVDVGGANSLDGLRALWRGLLKSKPTASLAALRHRGEGEQYRARHAVAAGCRTAQRRRGGGKNLRRLDRKPADMRDGGIRRSAPCDEGRRAGRFHEACRRQACCAAAESNDKRKSAQRIPTLHALVGVRRAVKAPPIKFHNYNVLGSDSHVLSRD